LGILFAGKISNPRDLKEILEMRSNEFKLRIKNIRSDVGGLLLYRRSSRQKHLRQSDTKVFPPSAEGSQDEDLA
jgi:hypothetical protein